MNRQKTSTSQKLIIAGVFLLPVVWFAILIAPYSYGGLTTIIQGLGEAVNHPFALRWCSNTPKSLFWCIAIYALAMLYYFSSQRNTRYGEEHGSATWGDPRKVSRALQSKEPGNDRLLSANIRMSYEFYKHRRNANMVVVGGAGTGKSRSVSMPNLMQCNSSYIVLDPKGGATRS